MVPDPYPGERADILNWSADGRRADASALLRHPCHRWLCLWTASVISHRAAEAPLALNVCGSALGSDRFGLWSFLFASSQSSVCCFFGDEPTLFLSAGKYPRYLQDLKGNCCKRIPHRESPEGAACCVSPSPSLACFP